MHISTSNTSMIAGKKATIVVHLASVLFAQLSYSCSSSALLQNKSDFNLTNSPWLALYLATPLCVLSVTRYGVYFADYDPR
jgi:hypothetical protein